jgi:hypothetical protein
VVPTLASSVVAGGGGGGCVSRRSGRRRDRALRGCLRTDDAVDREAVGALEGFDRRLGLRAERSVGRDVQSGLQRGDAVGTAGCVATACRRSCVGRGDCGRAAVASSVDVPLRGAAAAPAVCVVVVGRAGVPPAVTGAVTGTVAAALARAR